MSMVMVVWCLVVVAVASLQQQLQHLWLEHRWLVIGIQMANLVPIVVLFLFVV